MSKKKIDLGAKELENWYFESIEELKDSNIDLETCYNKKYEYLIVACCGGAFGFLSGVKEKDIDDAAIMCYRYNSSYGIIMGDYQKTKEFITED